MTVAHSHRAVWFLIALLAFCFTSAASAASGPVFPDAESVRPLPVGRRIPSPSVRTIEGESVDLATRLGDRGALLVFYRGGW